MDEWKDGQTAEHVPNYIPPHLEAIEQFRCVVHLHIFRHFYKRRQPIQIPLFLPQEVLFLKGPL